MHGPVDSIDHWCGSDPATGEACSCDEWKPLIREGKRRLGAGLVDVRVGIAACTHGSLAVAVRTAKGWFTAQVPPQDTNLLHCARPPYRAAGPTLRGTLASFEYWGRSKCWHHDQDWQWAEHGIVMFGVGPSGVPAVVPAIAIDRATVTWATDGAFDLEGDVGFGGQFIEQGVDDSDNRRGRHRLVFP